uniref:Uncharacterized protein n=1 Tax=Myotis myotis TaxID=51298 RepID=A0A7J7Y0E5_MYOMY|nr:hypothetical protein mMyoMyo1_011452 [Myotis myotis]
MPSRCLRQRNCPVKAAKAALGSYWGGAGWAVPLCFPVCNRGLLTDMLGDGSCGSFWARTRCSVMQTGTSYTHTTYHMHRLRVPPHTYISTLHVTHTTPHTHSHTKSPQPMKRAFPLPITPTQPHQPTCPCPWQEGS